MSSSSRNIPKFHNFFHIPTHEVFLSFRGPDTRATFASHLYTYLHTHGIDVFKDDHSIQIGDSISPSLFQAIEVSQISVIVFSVNYAGSQWCLNELAKIMECHRTKDHFVLPVFYGVDPSEVRNQTGEFGKVFRNSMDKILRENNEYDFLNLNLGMDSTGEFGKVFRNRMDQSLRENKEYDFLNLNLGMDSLRSKYQHFQNQLSQAASLSGFVVRDYRNESEAIKDIVKNVTRLLGKTDLFIDNNPVGIESRVEDMIQFLEGDIQQSNDVFILGIWGMGGVGKTTIAKAIYNKIGRKFNGRSFLANIRKVWKQNAGQVNLQERLLSDICKEMTTKIQSIENGKIILKDRLCNKRILIVLDDVSTLDQVNSLCGSYTCFGPGSRIIITTRDRGILRGNRIHEMKHMDEKESIELFSWHAFKQSNPIEDFVEISKNVVKYSGGLPFALKVLGLYLFDRAINEWDCILEKLKRIPNSQVQKMLKISYDGLEDDTVKEIFLDIACFFIGMDRNDVILILNDCGLFAETGIRILIEQNLVVVDDKNKLGMHDLLRDMGREIVREKSPQQPEARCRLWLHDDVLGVLSDQSGTKAIKGLALKLPRAIAKCFSTNAFKKMTQLRLLQLDGVKFDGDFEYLSTKLRWLSWNKFPLERMPPNLCRGNLVSIELESSNIRSMWKEAQMMENLKILNLSHSHYLTHTPDFSYMPNLEKLVLKDCPMLSEVSPTIGLLNKICLINLEDCIRLSSFPKSIYKLKSLKTLILSGCLKINKLEEDLEQMESSSNLHARLPFSLVRSKSIGYISMCGHQGFSRDVFPSIISSWMSPTNNVTSLFQTPAAMSSDVTVDEPSSSSHELSSFSNHLPGLRSLWVNCKSEDQLSLDVKIILDALNATVSKEVESIATTSQVSDMTTSTLIQRCSQVQILGSKHSLKSHLIQMGMDCHLTNILKKKILQNMDVNGSGGCLLPGDSYPDWLTFNSEGSSVTFKVPQVEGCNLKTMICIVYTSTPDNITTDGLKNVLVNNYTKATIQLYKREALVSFEDEERQRVVSSLESGNKVEVTVVFEKSFIVKKIAVYLVYDKSIGKSMNLYRLPDLNVTACSDDENECSTKRFLTHEDPMDDFNRNRKKKNRVE